MRLKPVPRQEGSPARLFSALLVTASLVSWPGTSGACAPQAREPGAADAADLQSRSAENGSDIGASPLKGFGGGWNFTRELPSRGSN